MGTLGIVLLTAVSASVLTGAAVWVLWDRVLAPDAERRLREIALELTATARAEVTDAGEALVPKFRVAVRDGIQDAFLTPPTDRIGQTAKGVTAAGVSVVESGLRRLLGPADRGRPAMPADPDSPPGSGPPAQ